MDIRYGMLNIKYDADITFIDTTIVEIDENGDEVHKPIQIPDPTPGKCSGDHCGKAIRNQESCFVDTQESDGRIYCDSCGKCLRYTRKMDDKRKNSNKLVSTKVR